MKIIFIKDAPGIGRKNELRGVPDGYANNFLIPKGLAEPATQQIISQLQNQTKQQQDKESREVERNLKLKQELDKKTFTIEVKAGEKNQIFGSVHEKDVALKIREKMNTEVEPSKIVLPKHIRELGEFEIEVKLGRGISAKPKIKLIKK